MFRMKTSVSVAILGLILTGHGVAQERKFDEKPPLAPAVQFTAHRDDEIAGAYTRDAVRISFTSQLETPTRAVIQVRLSDIILDAEIDLEKKTAILDGHGRALSFEQVKALQAVGNDLERYLDPDRRNPLPHEDMLYRVLSWYTMVPPGTPLNRLEVSAPVSTCYPTNNPSCRTGGICGAGGTEELCDCNGFFSCLDDNNDGICYLSNPNVCDYYDVWHDSLTHCFCRETRGAGCNLDSGCIGRGGAGCDGGLIFGLDCNLSGSGGAGTYTIDFVEHDRCCGLHDSGGVCDNIACADEAFDAANDCLFGQPNSAGCWCGNGVCDSGENASNCCGDCAQCCGDGDCNWPCEQCSGGSCVPRNTCDDGSCNCGENSGSCCEDCAQCCNTSDCGSCEICQGGACVSTCVSCESCQGGVCTSGCGPCEICQGGVCVFTCDACEDCQGGTCVPIQCDPCETCQGGGCVSSCVSCESCQDGQCVSGCPDCYTCQGDTCVADCDPCERCVSGQCADKCGDLICDEECGETTTCSIDCGCPNDTCATATVIGGLPYADAESTCPCADDYDDVCPYEGSTSGDAVYKYTAGKNECIAISLCDGSAYDTKVYVYANDCSGAAIACNDDSCATPNYPDPYVSELGNIQLVAGQTYYIVVDGYDGDCGEYTLVVEEAPCCDIICDPNATMENEPNCAAPNDTVNGGCNSPVPVSDCCTDNAAAGCDDSDCQAVVCAIDAFCCGATWDQVCADLAVENCGTLCDDVVYPYFSTISCDESMCGSGAFDGSTRDTDWYEITVVESTQLTWSVAAEFESVIGMVETIPLGSADCAHTTGFLRPAALPDLCDEGNVTVCVPPGTFRFFVAPTFSGAVQCPTGYSVRLGCEPCVPVQACCTRDGACEEKTEADCAAVGGTFHGLGTPCGPFTTDAGCDVDVEDFSGFQRCFTGFDQPYIPECDVFDFDRDGDIDYTDYRVLHWALENSGPK